MEKIGIKLTQWAKDLPGFLKRHKFQVAAIILLGLWCQPYFTTGSRIEWGDFSFFAQAYEAIRQSILDYHQFPWWNPWVAGGIPLYANPQMGVFSIQTVFVLLFGAPVGLKLTVALFTFAGYASMHWLLTRYFKVEHRLSILLSLSWVFCSFFVGHLPPHFTFIWYLLAPLYIYLALTVRNWKSGLVFGGAFALMALSAVHNPFFHISLICSVIIGYRLIRYIIRKESIKQFVWGLGAAAVLFGITAGHRVLMVAQNVQQFPREVPDPAAHPFVSFMGLVWPFSSAHLPEEPYRMFHAPFGFGEVTATIGFLALIVAGLCFLFVLYQTKAKWAAVLKQYRLILAVSAAGLVCFALGFGAVDSITPYNLLKQLPVFGEMRVSSRWFVFFDITVLIFIGVIVTKAPRKSFFKFAAYALMCLSVLQLFLINFGYQNRILRHDVVQPKKESVDYTFVQTSQFGTLQKLPDGTSLKGNELPHFYREFEATMFNTGVLQANDALVDLNTKSSPRCGFEKGCSNVLSGNALVTHWSPNKIVLKRTGNGPIKLNMNNSSYYVINGKRNEYIRVSEPYKDFSIKLPDSVKTITITVQPGLPL